MDNRKNDAYYIQKITTDLAFITAHTEGLSQEQFEEREVLLDSVMFRSCSVPLRLFYRLLCHSGNYKYAKAVGKSSRLLSFGISRPCRCLCLWQPESSDGQQAGTLSCWRRRRAGLNIFSRPGGRPCACTAC